MINSRNLSAQSGGKSTACLAHREARPAGGGANVGDRRVCGAYCQKTSDCHQATSSGRSGSVPPWTGRRSQDRRTAAWSSAVPRKVHSGRYRSRSPPGAGTRPGWPRTTQARPRLGGGKHLAGGTCRFRGYRGASPFRTLRMSASRANPSSRRTTGGLPRPSGVSPFLARHVTTVDQSRQPRGRLRDRPPGTGALAHLSGLLAGHTQAQAPLSTSACRTHLRSVSALPMPSLAATALIAG